MGREFRSFASAGALAALAAAAVLAWWHVRIEGPIGAPVVTFQTFDDYVYYYPTFHYAFTEARAGRLPFWNPYQHCGTPFFATAQHLLLYPLNLAFWLLPTGAAMKLTNQFHIALALAFTFLLGRVVGLSRVGAVSAAVVYGFCPGLALLIYLPHHLYGAVWIPLHLALTHLAMTDRRTWIWGLLLSFALAAQYLGGYPMFCLFSLYAVAGYAIWSACAEWLGGTPPGRIARRVTAVGGALVLAGAWSAPQLLPAIELAAQSPRHAAALTVRMADPRPRGRDVGGLVLATLVPMRDASFFRPHPHVGPLAALLALAALLHRRQRRTTGFFVLLALCAGLLALGRSTPVYAFYFELPTGNLFRVPDRFFILVSLGLAVLAGVGADYLWRRKSPSRSARWAALSAGIVLAALALAAPPSWQAEAARGTKDAAELLRDVRLRLLAPYLIAASMWLSLYLTLSGWARRLLVVTVPVALYATLFQTFINYSPLPDTHPNLHTMPPAVASFLHEHQGFARTYIPPPGPFGTAARIPSKAGMLEHLYTVGDRENVFLSRLWDYTALFQARRRLGIGQGEFHVSSASRNLRLLDLMGVRTIVERPPGLFLKPNATRTFPVIYRDPSTRIYENPPAKERAYLVYEAEVAASPESALQRLADPRFSIDDRVVLEAPATPRAAPSPVGARKGSSRIVRYEAHEVAIETDTAEPAYLILTDQHYPGWQAEVDGQPTEIYRANYLFRAVPVPGGRHRVTFRYVPRSFYVGLLIASVVGAGALAVFWSVRLRSRRPVQPIVATLSGSMR